MHLWGGWQCCQRTSQKWSPNINRPNGLYCFSEIEALKGHVRRDPGTCAQRRSRTPRTATRSRPPRPAVCQPVSVCQPVLHASGHVVLHGGQPLDGTGLTHLTRSQLTSHRLPMPMPIGCPCHCDGWTMNRTTSLSPCFSKKTLHLHLRNLLPPHTRRIAAAMERDVIQATMLWREIAEGVVERLMMIIVV